MKLSRTLATGAVATLAGASLMLGASAAVAADLHVVDSDFVHEADYESYPNQWFIGDGSLGSISSGPRGLVMDATAGKLQILNGDSPRTGLLELVAGADLQASGDAAALERLKFQIAVFADPASDGDKVFTTLYPRYAGPSGLDVAQQWVTSWPIPATATTPAYVKSATATLEEFEAALAAINPETGYEILAFGAFIDPGHVVTVSSITWAGDTYRFTPAIPTTPPALAPAPEASPDVALAAADGKPGETHTVSFPDGTFDPFENVFATWYSSPVFGGWFQANSLGGLTATLTIPAALDPGSHTLQFTGSTTGVTASGTFNVLALAATGAEAAPLVIAASVLLLAGVGFGIVGQRRRKSARGR